MKIQHKLLQSVWCLTKGGKVWENTTGAAAVTEVFSE